MFGNEYFVSLSRFSSKEQAFGFLRKIKIPLSTTVCELKIKTKTWNLVSFLHVSHFGCGSNANLMGSIQGGNNYRQCKSPPNKTKTKAMVFNDGKLDEPGGGGGLVSQDIVDHEEEEEEWGSMSEQGKHLNYVTTEKGNNESTQVSTFGSNFWSSIAMFA